MDGVVEDFFAHFRLRFTGKFKHHLKSARFHGSSSNWSVLLELPPETGMALFLKRPERPCNVTMILRRQSAKSESMDSKKQTTRSPIAPVMLSSAQHESIQAQNERSREQGATLDSQKCCKTENKKKRYHTGSNCGPYG
jgi:hypothetical protein